MLLGYLATAIALLCGLPVLVIGWFAATQCTAEGFTCLGWFVGGMMGAVTVAAVVALPIAAWRLRLGWLFALLTVVLVVLPLALGDGSPNAGAAVLGPGLAAWISEPRRPDPATANPLAPPVEPTPAVRHWLPRAAAVGVFSLAIPLLGRVI